MKHSNQLDISDLINTKPEPISAKANWHYDSYFLAQLARLNKGKIAPNKDGVEQSSQAEEPTGTVEMPGSIPFADSEE